MDRCIVHLSRPRPAGSATVAAPERADTAGDLPDVLLARLTYTRRGARRPALM
jgi:hypothetical protein